jgi:hypothetical protein
MQRLRAAGETTRRLARRSFVPVQLLLVALVITSNLSVGTTRISLYRIVLLVMVVPCLIMWVSGRAGRIRLPDVTLLLLCFWSILSLVSHAGFYESIQTAGIVFVETAGPYFLARCFIRSADDLTRAVRLWFGIVFVLLPFALIEALAGQYIFRDLLAMIGVQVPVIGEVRSGLHRAQTVFDHPILFGLSTGGFLALVHLVLGYGQPVTLRALRTGIVGLTSLLSLSAGPIGGILFQCALLGWNWLLSAVRGRWVALIVLAGLGTLILQLAAGRSPFQILAGMIVFESDSYWYRLLIFNYAWQSIENNPLLGVGAGDWVRPAWMHSSIDNFYLFMAVRHGLPAPALLLLAAFSLVFMLARKKGLDGRLDACRTGFVICIVSCIIVAWSVALWDAAYVLFLFWLGSGVWMLDARGTSSQLGGRTSPFGSRHKAQQRF